MIDIPYLQGTSSAPTGGMESALYAAYINRNLPDPRMQPSPWSPINRSDYDYASAWRDNVGVGPTGEDGRGHFPDTYKLPWHPNQSDESMYYNQGDPAKHWTGVGDEYAPAGLDYKPWITASSTMTKAYEGGFHSKPYEDRDVKGNLLGYSIGYGEFLGKEKPPAGTTRTEAQARTKFSQQYIDALRDAQEFAEGKFYDLSASKRSVLIDMAYNMGREKFMGPKGFSKMRTALREGNDERVRAEMIDSDWYNQVGNRSKEHVARWR